MRRILYFTLGFSAACAGMLYADFWAVRLGGLILALLLTLVEKQPGWTRRAVLVFLGFALGSLWFLGYSRLYLSPLQALDGEVTTCTIRAEDCSRETDYGLSLEGSVSFSGKRYAVSVFMEDGEAFAPGDTVTGPFRLRLTTDAGENPASYYPGKGIFLLAYQQGEPERGTTPQTWRDIPAKVRGCVLETLQACVPEDCEPFARALLLGDTSKLSYQTNTALKISGIRHVVAVSGLHISVLFTLIGYLTFRKRLLTALVGIPVLFFFAAVVGFTPSVTRACIMMGLMLLSEAAFEEYDGPTALAFSVLVMLVGNPYAAGSVSLQLSFASVLGILLFSRGIYGWLTSWMEGRKGRLWKTVRKALAGLSVTVGAQIFTIPLCAGYFGTVSLAGTLTNLLVLWAISLTFCLLVGACFATGISLSLAGILGRTAAIFIRYVLWAAKAIAAFPLACAYTASPYVVAWLCFGYGLVLLFFLSGRKARSLFLCCGILGLCLALSAAWLEPMMHSMTFTVLDVGQGQCLLMQSQGKTCLVDCGGDHAAADKAAEALLRQGNTRLDVLILTHTDADHAGAAADFLSRIPTDVLIVPETSLPFSVPENTRTVYASSDLEIRSGDMKATVFAPVYGKTGNEISLCVLFETENCDILITGDRDAFGERSLLRHSKLPDVDVLIAGHHGAESSTCEQLLQAVKPEIVCISVGAGNPYGHPAPALLERLSDFGCRVYRTDLQGTITIRR